jgi:NTP pyrophosphatase (non-canonical NTP hydrolase)
MTLGSHQSLPIILGRVTSEMGELLSAAAKDMQTGTLTATNAATVLDETDDVVAAVLQLRAEARARLARKAGA